MSNDVLRLVSDQTNLYLESLPVKTHVCLVNCEKTQLNYEEERRKTERDQGREKPKGNASKWKCKQRKCEQVKKREIKKRHWMDNDSDALLRDLGILSLLR